MRTFALAALMAAVAAPASAEVGGAAILYANGHFSGPSITVTGPTTGMRPFNVKSLRIPAGTVWELCSGNTFSGCETYTQSKQGMVRMVRSVRPVAAPIAADVAAPALAAASGAAASLRGLQSEFFVLPERAGARVEVASAGTRSRNAAEFCRSKGWRSSAYERLQSVSGRMFLADVLCTDQDR